MKYLSSLLSVLFLGFIICAYAGVPPAHAEQPEDVVKSLYRDFGWELTAENSTKAILIDQPLKVLKQYFTHKFAGLIVKDRNYVKRTRELGHIDFVLLCGSQDPDGIRNIRIKQKSAKNVVGVVYDQNGEKDVMRIEYDLIQTESGWRISEMRYKERKSTAFPNPGPELTLKKLLSQPY